MNHCRMDGKVIEFRKFSSLEAASLGADLTSANFASARNFSINPKSCLLNKTVLESPELPAERRFNLALNLSQRTE